IGIQPVRRLGQGVDLGRPGQLARTNEHWSARSDRGQGVQNMQESTTYQAILKQGLDKGLIEGRNEGLIEGRNEGLIEGRVSEAQRFVLMLGATRFGEADEAIRRSVESILELERLERVTR